MSDRDRHPTEAIHALVDGRLDAEERGEVERHLETCARCRAERDAVAATRGIVRRSLSAPPPPALVARIGAALDEVDRRKPVGGAVWGRLVWLAPVLLLALALVWWVTTNAPLAPPLGERILASVSEDFAAVQNGTLALDLPDADPRKLERFFADSGIDFETRVFNLTMMGLQLAGGRVQPLADRTSALFAYRGPAGRWMICRMFLGRLNELPEPARIVEHDGIVFHVYARDGRTLVFWEEGRVVCALVSDAPAQDVIDLSLAKAVKIE